MLGAPGAAALLICVSRATACCVERLAGAASAVLQSAGDALVVYPSGKETTMKTLLTAIALAVASVSAFAQAADAPAKAPTAQQNKMAVCNKEAGDKKGDERKAFMSQCLKKDSDGKTAQQQKMKSCSADFKASGKPGSERQAYMKECLSK